MSAATGRPRRILVHDFVGHPFQAQLSRALAARGHQVLHAHCGGVTTGKGALDLGPDDPASLRFLDVQPTHFERYAALGRLRSEVAYGRRLARVAQGFRPDSILSANTPLLAQAQLWRAGRRLGSRRVFWLQDLLGRGTRAVLDDRSPLLGHTAGRSLEGLERALLRRSEAVVVITEDFVDEVRRAGRRQPPIVVENWAPLDAVPVRPKANPWSERHGLSDRPVALYSGTLGLKHDPEHLVVAAQELARSAATVVVVTEGLGRDHLEARRAELGLSNLHLFDYVPHDVLPDVIGTADVALVLLEPEAGHFSVPSKTLTYLAAGRAVVGAIPEQNLAARLITRIGAGTVVRPGDRTAFAGAVEALLAAPDRAAAMGAAGRRHAVEAFDIDRIATVFEQVLDES